MPGHRDELFAKGSLAILLVQINAHISPPCSHDHAMAAMPLPLGCPGSGSEADSLDDEDDLRNGLVDSFARGDTWWQKVIDGTSIRHCMLKTLVQLSSLSLIFIAWTSLSEATAKDVMEQARRTRKLLKSHGHLLWSFFYKHFSVVDIKNVYPHCSSGTIPIRYQWNKLSWLRCLWPWHWRAGCFSLPRQAWSEPE